MLCEFNCLPENGRIFPSESRTVHYNETIRYECFDSFKLEGEARSRCMADHRLSHLRP